MSYFPMKVNVIQKWLLCFFSAYVVSMPLAWPKEKGIKKKIYKGKINEKETICSAFVPSVGQEQESDRIFELQLTALTGISLRVCYSSSSTLKELLAFALATKKYPGLCADEVYFKGKKISNIDQKLPDFVLKKEDNSSPQNEIIRLKIKINGLEEYVTYFSEELSLLNNQENDENALYKVYEKAEKKMQKAQKESSHKTLKEETISSLKEFCWEVTSLSREYEIKTRECTFNKFFPLFNDPLAPLDGHFDVERLEKELICPEKKMQEENEKKRNHTRSKTLDHYMQKWKAEKSLSMICSSNSEEHDTDPPWHTTWKVPFLLMIILLLSSAAVWRSYWKR